MEGVYNVYIPSIETQIESPPNISGSWSNLGIELSPCNLHAKFWNAWQIKRKGNWRVSGAK